MYTDARTRLSMLMFAAPSLGFSERRVSSLFRRVTTTTNCHLPSWRSSVSDVMKPHYLSRQRSTSSGCFMLFLLLSLLRTCVRRDYLTLGEGIHHVRGCTLMRGLLCSNYENFMTNGPPVDEGVVQNTLSPTLDILKQSHQLRSDSPTSFYVSRPIELPTVNFLLAPLF